MEQKLKINCVIGVDPGGNGGIAVFIPGDSVKTVKMPKDLTDLRDFFAYYVETYKPIVFLEKLTVRPDDITPDASENQHGKVVQNPKDDGQLRTFESVD